MYATTLNMCLYELVQFASIVLSIPHSIVGKEDC